MIFKFKARGRPGVFQWVDLSAVVSILADDVEFELDLIESLDDEVPTEVDIIPAHDAETSAEAMERIIDAWRRARQRKANW
jgi:hypothetical protein